MNACAALLLKLRPLRIMRMRNQFSIPHDSTPCRMQRGHFQMVHLGAFFLFILVDKTRRENILTNIRLKVIWNLDYKFCYSFSSFHQICGCQVDFSIPSILIFSSQVPSSQWHAHKKFITTVYVNTENRSGPILPSKKKSAHRRQTDVKETPNLEVVKDWSLQMQRRSHNSKQTLNIMI